MDCLECGGSGVNQGAYLFPLNDKATAKGIDLVALDLGLQNDHGKEEGSAQYYQLGRNFAAFIIRNTPKAYLDGVADRLAKSRTSKR